MDVIIKPRRNLDNSYSYNGACHQTCYDDNQGGEFINQTLGETVPFRYGRVIEFETHQLHRGMAFNIPNVARYSLKFVGKEIEWH